MSIYLKRDCDRLRTPKVDNRFFVDRHIRQTKAEARTADGEGAGELAGNDEPGALNIRRRAAAGRTAQGAVGRVDPALACRAGPLGPPPCVHVSSLARPLVCPDI